MWLYVYMSAFAKEYIVGVANKYYYSLYSSAQPRQLTNLYIAGTMHEF